MNSRNNCWLTAVQLSGERRRPFEIIEALKESDIESRPIWKPLHLQPVFNHCDFITEVENQKIIDEKTGADNSVAGNIFCNGLCLPSDTKMTDDDLERVCNVLLVE